MATQISIKVDDWFTERAKRLVQILAIAGVLLPTFFLVTELYEMGIKFTELFTYGFIVFIVSVFILADTWADRIMYKNKFVRLKNSKRRKK